MLGLAAASLLAVAVDGTGSCPAPDEVERLLAPLIGPAVAQGDRVLLEERGGKLHVRLRDATGTSRVEGELAATDSCDGLALSAAVMVAAWEANLAPLPLDTPELPRSPLRPVRILAPPLEAADRGGTRVVAGLGVGASFSDATTTAASGFAYVGGRLAPWSLGVSAGVSSPRQTALGPGTVSWQRFEVGAGARQRLFERWAAFDGGLELVGSLLRVKGQGFSQDEVSSTTELGGRLSITAVAPWRPLSIWLGASVTGWATDQRLVVANAPGTANLPRFEGVLLIGSAFASP